MAKSKKKSAKKKSVGRAKKKSATSGRSATASVRARPEIDFDDEDEVLRVVAEHLDEDVDGLSIRVTEMFSDGTSYEVTNGRRSWHDRRSWKVYRSEDEAYNEALLQVKQDLNESPEMFNQYFIEGHINMEKLKEVVYESKMEDDALDDMANRNSDDFWEEYERVFSVDEYEVTDDDGDTVLPDDVPDEAIEALKSHYAHEVAKDPMGYFRDIYGNEAPKFAIQAVGFDVDAAAEDAVRIDGWAHFISRYDGNYDELRGGMIVFRTD